MITIKFFQNICQIKIGGKITLPLDPFTSLYVPE